MGEGDEERAQKQAIEPQKPTLLVCRLSLLAWQAPVLTLGSIHLSLMAAIGIWLWSNPSGFGTAIACDPSLAIAGSAVPFSSTALKICSLLVYSHILFPVLNLVFPFLPLPTYPIQSLPEL